MPKVLRGRAMSLVVATALCSCSPVKGELLVLPDAAVAASAHVDLAAHPDLAAPAAADNSSAAFLARHPGLAAARRKAEEEEARAYAIKEDDQQLYTVLLRQ